MLFRSREQLAIAEFANALLVIPKTLAVNAAKDSTELIAKLRAYHNAAQSAPVGDPKRGLRFYGLDLAKGEVRDNIKAGVLEPSTSKIKSFKSALEASTALLRIDDRVRPSPFVELALVDTACCSLRSQCLRHNKEETTGTAIRRKECSPVRLRSCWRGRLESCWVASRKEMVRCILNSSRCASRSSPQTAGRKILEGR